MAKLISLYFILFSTLLFAQKDNFNKEITKVKGDLNKDGLIDYVLVSQDTLNDEGPYKLEIYFAETNGKFKPILSSTKAIDPAFPEGKKGYYSGNAFSEITIKKGILSINIELTRGHYEHKFRFQNGNFELIGFSEAYSDGLGTMTTIDFNLSTGIRIKDTERYDDESGKPTHSQKKVLIRPLPKLQDFVSFQTEFY
ncbi:hypothetical protein [Flavobacterium sp. ABG]|uniref:hypothetical protein n=1 Tax=Flavobacterium sp. ABG TaxID=1423322 RepID=UPI0006498CBB|nr:hypothetical protein [Flavobacterium sp. ABG]KLT69886.1 hypothetical protein AB674_09270 [Flavobacterium sp. ABG]